MKSTINAINADAAIIPNTYTTYIHTGHLSKNIPPSLKSSGVEKEIHNEHVQNTIEARIKEIVCNLYPDSI